jgi:hypothetical protein
MITKKLEPTTRRTHTRPAYPPKRIVRSRPRKQADLARTTRAQLAATAAGRRLLEAMEEAAQAHSDMVLADLAVGLGEERPVDSRPTWVKANDERDLARTLRRLDVPPGWDKFSAKETSDRRREQRREHYRGAYERAMAEVEAAAARL